MRPMAGSVLLLAGMLWMGGSTRAGHAKRLGEGSDTLSISLVSAIENVRASEQSGEVPRRINDTLAVRGRVSAGRGILPDSTVIFIQDRTAGIAVRLPEGASVAQGDVLRAEGVLRHRSGHTYLEGLRLVEGQKFAWEPTPISVTVATAPTTAHEGELVQIQGQVAVKGQTDTGDYVLLADEGQRTGRRIAVLIPHARSEMSLNQFKMGNKVRVTGVLSRTEALTSYDVAYRVLPRTEEDLRERSDASGGIQTVILFIVGGTLFAVIAVVTLRSAVRRRSQQLIQSRARFRRLAEATREGIILHRDGEILNVNRALTNMTGYNREELVGRSFLKVVAESVPKLDLDALQADTEGIYETVAVRKDGSSFPAEVDERVVAAGSKRVRVVAIRDITERKRRETELRTAKEEAEQMAELKSSLLNNMSHEFRTPITSILGYADLIMEEAGTDLQEFARHIRESGERLSRTLRTVLEMAQIEGGRMSVDREPVDIGPLLKEVVDEHRSDDSPSFDITGTACTVQTDGRLLRRILENLIHNAAKFTPETGQVVVQVSSTQSSVDISVSDSGIGIDPEFQDNLFVPFEQESTGRTRTHEGTGLGLSLTKRMLDLLNGTIEVDSEKGTGTTVTVSLPSAPADLTSSAAEAANTA